MNPASAIPAAPPAPTPQAAPNNDPSQFGEYSEWAQENMAKGVSADDLRQTLQKNGVDLGGSSNPQPDNGQQPAWWQKLLPTAGGIVGGLVGSIGDLAGPLGVATTTGGAAAGGALGQAIENILTGKNAIQGNDLSAAVDNGVGNLVGLGVAKAAGGLVKGATGAIGGAVEGRAAQAATDEAAQAAERAAASKQAEIQRLADEFKVQPGTGDLGTKTGDVAANLQKLGHEKPMAQDAVNVGNVITGSNENGAGILNHAKQDILNTAGGHMHIGQIGDATTPSGKFFTQLRDPSMMAQLGDPLDPKGGSAASLILSKFNTLANGAGVPAEGAGTITPQSGFKLLSDVADEARQASQAARKLNASTSDTAKATVWNNLRDNLKTALYDRPEVNDAVAGYKATPEMEARIDQKIAAEGIQDPKVATTLKQAILDTLNKGGKMQDWLDVEKGGVDLSKVGSSALKQQGNISAASTQRLAKGQLTADNAEPDHMPAPGKGPGTALLDMGSMAAAPLTHGLSLIGLAPHVLSAAKNPAIQDAAYKALTKVTSSKVANKVIPTLMRSGAIAASNAPSIADQGQTAIPANGTPPQGASMNPGSAIPTGNPVSGAVDSALTSMQQPGASLTPGYGTMGAVLTALAPQALKQQMAGQSVTALDSAYGNAGGPSGFGGGLLNEILAKLVPGSAPATYSAEQHAAAAQLSAVTGVPVDTILKSLPQMMQTPTTAGPAQQNVSSILNTLTAPSAAPAQ